MKLTVDSALAGKRILVTGVTGFVGKAVLEKLLRAVPAIAGVVLPMRGSRAHPDACRRFEAEVLASPVFDVLRQAGADRLHQLVHDKVRVVAAEISEPGLGLSADAFEALAHSVDLVINVAASVDFREALDQALRINTYSVRELARLARERGIPLVQVSTCYVNGFRRGRIAEEMAPPLGQALERRAEGSFAVDALIEELQRKADDAAQRESDPLLRTQALVDLGCREARRLGWNDTYTLTKWLGEQVVWQDAAGASRAIVRPAIVESAVHEPQPGWIEGMKVGDAIVLAYARGKTRVFPARRAGVADIVPVDLVANAIVLAAAEASAHPGHRRIVQVGSSTRNPVRVGDYVRLCQHEMRAHAARYPRLIRAPLRKAFRTVPRPVFLAYLGAACTAAAMMNGVARWAGAAADLPLHQAMQTTSELAKVFSFYTSPRYVFDSSQLMALAQRFDADTRRRFEIDARCFDWEHYVTRVHLPGLERFAVKQAPASTATEAAPERLVDPAPLMPPGDAAGSIG